VSCGLWLCAVRVGVEGVVDGHAAVVVVCAVCRIDWKTSCGHAFCDATHTMCALLC
jgi:hypothetical protein